MRKLRSYNFKKGDFVNVYQKPFTREDFEGVAVIIKVYKELFAFDLKGYKLYEAKVMFTTDGMEVDRKISEKYKGGIYG